MAPLSQGLGYGLVIGIGAGFAFGMIALTRALARYQKERMSAEEFATAGRSVKSGLIASAVISSWCWPTSTLVSSSQSYSEGISGGLYYASGGSVICFIFAMLAMEVKRKAPGAHTYLEVIRFRFGKPAHFVYMFFAWAVSILVTAELQIGAAAVINYLTDMHMVAAIFLGILSPFAYTLFGGLMATFITDYVHTLVILILAMVFVFNFYLTNETAGPLNEVYDKIMSYPTHIEGNAEGSLLTLRSHNGGIFLLYCLCTVIPLVVIDQGYWNKALAASPRAVLPGYIMGGLSWYAIPFSLAGAIGLAARILESTPAWTLPPLTSADVSAGNVFPAAAVALLGRNGAVCAVILILMSVTSTASAEMVAVSTIWTYDVYKSYINPKATDKQLIFTTHAAVIVFVLAISGFSTGLYYAGIDISWLFFFNAIIGVGAVVPAHGVLFWKRLNKWSATVAPILGLATGIACWLGVTAGLNDSKVSVATTSQYYPGIAGMLIGMFSPVLYIAILQLIFGNDDYDFEEMKSLRNVRDKVIIEESDEKLGQSPSESIQHSDEKGTNEVRVEDWENENYLAEENFVSKYIVPSRWLCFVLLLCLVIIWPIPMYASSYVFSRPFFRGWVSVSIIWLFLSFFLVGILPVIQGRKMIWHVIRALIWDLSGQSKKVKTWQHEHPEELHQNFELA